MSMYGWSKQVRTPALRLEMKMWSILDIVYGRFGRGKDKC